MKQFLICCLLLLVILSINLPALADETIAITGTVAPKTTDFQYALTKTDNKQTVKQDESLSYQIDYGAKASAGVPTTTTLTVDWSEAKAPDGTIVVDYLSGSASNAYNATAPVIDPVNKRLTWTIQNLPAGIINQKVNFQLKTNSNYSGSETSNIIIKSSFNNQYISLPEQSLSQNYQYQKQQSLVTPTLTPTLAPATTPTPTVIPSIPNLKIANISINKILKDQVSISFDTTNPAKALLRFGTAANNLAQQVALSTNTTQQISLEDLNPATIYYFQIIATNPSTLQFGGQAGSGQKVISDIFTFKTAEAAAPPPTFEDNIVTITSHGNVLISDIKIKNAPSQTMALVTTDTPYEITYRLKKKINLKSIEAVMKNKNVLGINTFSNTQGASTFVVAMQEIQPYVYTARLKTDIPGTFDVFVRMEDTKGNLTEEKVAETKIMPLLSVSDKVDNTPIADARVFFTYYNNETKRYEPLSQTTLENITNPGYTTINGTVKILLPTGKYRAEVSAFGYDKRTIDFILGTKSGQEFPQIKLNKNASNLFNYVEYYTNALTDFVGKIQTSLSGLSFSIRFFNLLFIFILIMAIIVTILFFQMRTHVSPFHLIPYFIHHFKELFHKHTLSNFCATITDEKGNKISDARVATIDDETGEVVTSFVSNKNGICYVLNPKQKNILKLLITKDGFAPKTVAIESDISNSSHGLAIVMRKGQKPSQSIASKLWDVTAHIGGLFFELSLLGSFILELMFFSLFGFGKTAPFFALTLFTLLLWIFYQREKQARKVFRKP